MLQHLLESQANVTPRIGGSLISTAVHVAGVAALIALTARHETPPRQVREAALHFVPTPRTAAVTPPHESPPSVARRAIAMASASTTPVSVALAVVMIPLALPDVNLTHGIVGANDLRATIGSTGTATGSPSELNSGNDHAFSANEVEVPVVLAPGSPTPAYPDMLRSAAVAGGVLVEFVVDTSGRVEPGSLRIVHADHELFAVSVRAVAPRLRFLPAKAQGRSVRQLVRLPFRFAIHS